MKYFSNAISSHLPCLNDSNDIEWYTYQIVSNVHHAYNIINTPMLKLDKYPLFSSKVCHFTLNAILQPKHRSILHACRAKFKPCTHDQICIRMQILHICKICIRTQIWPCVRIYSRMQNLHVCKSWKICTCLRPSANLILRICKICVYANLVM